MNLIGYRKFIVAILGLISFTLIMIKNTAIDPFNLGLGIAVVVGAFSGADAWKEFARVKRNKNEV